MNLQYFKNQTLNKSKNYHHIRGTREETIDRLQVAAKSKKLNNWYLLLNFLNWQTNDRQTPQHNFKSECQNNLETRLLKDTNSEFQNENKLM